MQCYIISYFIIKKESIMCIFFWLIPNELSVL